MSVMDASILINQFENSKLLINYRIFRELGNSPGSFGKLSTFSGGTLIFASMLLLSACDKLTTPSIKQICEDHPSMCNTLNQDGWCRAEKADIIRHRFAQRNTPAREYNEATYHYLVKLEHYQACVAKAAQIRYIKHREKEAGRMAAFEAVRQEIKTLGWRTRESTNPYLSYYHWSRHHNEAAGKRFAAMAAQGKFDRDPALLVAFASMQIKQDANATRTTLYRALALYQDPAQIDQEVFATLVSLTLTQQNYRLAYVWGVVASHFEAQTSLSQFQSMVNQHDLPAAILNQIAEEIIDRLEDGDFDADALALDRV